MSYYVNSEGRRGAGALHDVGGVEVPGSPSPPAGIYTRRPMQRASCNRLVVNREIICSQPDIDNRGETWTGAQNCQSF